jgi:hypothetical protein
VISGDLRRIDAALNVLVPNYSLLANLSLGQLVLTVWYPPGPLKWAWLGWAFLMLLLQAGYLLLGVLIGGSFRKTVPALLLAPPFLVWKLFVDLLAVLGVGRTTWSRTARNVEY